jgi:hypothetical protein
MVVVEYLCRGALLERERTSNRELVARLIEMESRVSSTNISHADLAVIS